MAKKTTTPKGAVSDAVKGDIKKLSAFLSKLNSDSTSLAHNSLSVNMERIDTGNYAFNAILSGSLYGGVPVGLVTGFAGPSGCGKSLMAAKVVSNAQKKGYFAIIFDSESGWNQGMEKLGVDISNCHIMPVATVEETKSQIMKAIEEIKTNYKDQKVIMVLDSLGALSSEKEVTDSMKGSTAVDMGTRAKIIRSMARQITMKCKTANIPFIFTNHTYDSPNAMPSYVKEQSGGKGIQYMATVLVQLSANPNKIKKDKDKEDDDDEDTTESSSLGIAHGFNGANVTLFTTKNRGVPKYLKSEMSINFITGLDKYSGLFEMAQEMGVILGNRSYYLPDGTKLGFKKDILPDVDKWENVIMPVLEKVVNEKIKYSDVALGTLSEINPDIGEDNEDDADDAE